VTQDHRVVTYNSVFDRLSDTTLSMDELARRFKASKAGVTVCILDCCFSGGALARVLEGNAVPRSPSVSFADISTAAFSSRIRFVLWKAVPPLRHSRSATDVDDKIPARQVSPLMRAC
jgi:hypothetical protein